MKPKIIKKNTIRKNLDMLICLLMDWNSFHGECKTSMNDVLDMLHLSTSTYKYLKSCKNGVERDVLIDKIYSKYLETKGKFTKNRDLNRLIEINDMILNRRITPIDYSDILKFGWEYENFRWLFNKLIMNDDDVIDRNILSKNIDQYIRFFIRDHEELENTICTILDTDSIYSISSYTFHGLCRVFSYILGVNSTFLEGRTYHPVLLRGLTIDLLDIEIDRLLVLHSLDQGLFDLNDRQTCNDIMVCITEPKDDYLKERTRLFMKYNIKVDHYKKMSIYDFKKELKYYDQFVKV